MEQFIHLNSSFKIPVDEYASQGNAILGIRDAGKTYTAMKAAEELLDASVPIIVFDPVGVWKNLKVGAGKHKGYPVVVAGGQGSDIILTVHNAVDVVRAAMKENVSLVIDLYSPELINKSTWIRIVQEVVDVLMYENKAYGLRHIFIEEAAEFIPQRIQPQHAKVYASIERLARMGRNARLGYTLINQRAEEVNKAILEISTFSLLHKQVGKNSLKSIQQWLELRQLTNTKEIIKSLPTLKQGECWAVGLTDQPELVQVAVRNTYHPNPRKDVGVAQNTKVANVSEFVIRMNELLVKEQPAAKSPKTIPNDQTDLISELKAQKDAWQREAARWEAVVKELSDKLSNIHRLSDSTALVIPSKEIILEKFQQLDRKVSDRLAVSAERFNTRSQKATPSPRATPGDTTLGKCAREILRFLAQYPGRSFSIAQVAIATNYSPASGGFNNALSALNSLELINRNPGRLELSAGVEERAEQVIGKVERRQYDIETFKDNLGKCEREIYEVLLRSPNATFTKETLALATETNYSSRSGGFNNALSRLSTLKLIIRENGSVRLNPELLELL